MNRLRISTAQFENRNGDKAYNLSVIEKLTKESKREGADIVAFHECSITGYSFARHLSKNEMLQLSEFVPQGESIGKLTTIARDNKIVVMAGLFERDENENLFNTYVCVDKNGLIARYRKLHPFINPYLKTGDTYCVFEIHGWKCGILICYDNNIVENVRATKLLGADIIFMPHVTMCTPSERPGSGFVDSKLWENREDDPTSLRLEFEGMKGKAWLMKWLPARAYDNAAYVVFSNPVGMDDDQLKNGCSMIIDPFGDVIAECRSFDDCIATATITPDKVAKAGGSRYLKARRPELYRDIIGEDHLPDQQGAWLHDS